MVSAAQRVFGEAVERRSPMRSLLGFLWQVPACVLAYLAGLVAGGAVVAVTGLEMPKMPVEMSQAQQLQAVLLSGLVVVLGLAPLAARQRGAWLARWLALALFGYVSMGLNTAIEASFFTKIGGMTAQALVFVAPLVLVAAGVAWSFGSSHEAEAFGPRVARFFGARRPVQWAWRLLLVVLAFPAIYWIFGMLLMTIRPDLMELYKNGEMGLIVPAPGVIVSVATLRSGLFLAAVLPVLILWDGSRTRLALTLGLALTALVGLSGLISASWMSMEMRVGHGLEITADSFAHAAALVALLVPKQRAAGSPAGNHT